MLSKFVELIIEWNAKINLISRKDVENIWQRHLLGSLAMLFNFQLKENANVVDVGTGGGFPGIPLAICLPDVSFTLVDSIQKKVNVVTDIIEKLQLHNAKVLCGRAEELNMKAVHNRKFDYVTARAVAPITDVIGWTKMFLRTVPPTSSVILSPRFIGGEESQKRQGVEILHFVQNDKIGIAPGAIIIFKGGDVTPEIQQARIKYKPKSIETLPLVIDGIDPAEFSEKKLVIVRP